MEKKKEIKKVFLKVSPELHSGIRGLIRAKNLNNTDELIYMLIGIDQTTTPKEIVREDSQKQIGINDRQNVSKKVAPIKFEPTTFYRFKGLSKALKKTYMELIETIIKEQKGNNR